ncbi:MAG: nuclear transport factor 2 family protein [Aggregatilineales bacterium]
MTSTIIIPEPIANAIDELQNGWNALNFDHILNLWDHGYKHLIYIPEERPTLRGIDEIAAYFNTVAAMMVNMTINLTVIDCDLFNDSAWAVCRGEWTGQNKYREVPSGGEARVSFMLHKVGDDWKLIQYIEAVLNHQYAPPENIPE